MNRADYLDRCAALVRDRRLSLAVGRDLAGAFNETLLADIEAATDDEIRQLNQLHHLRRVAGDATAAAAAGTPGWALLAGLQPRPLPPHKSPVLPNPVQVDPPLRVRTVLVIAAVSFTVAFVLAFAIVWGLEVTA